MIGTVFTTLGAGDCEALSTGWLVQPVAAWTSLAYSIVGLVLVLTAPSSPSSERPLRITFGFLLVGTGMGSFLYHGPQPEIAGFAHDFTFLTALWFLIIMNPTRAYRFRRSWAWASLVGVAVTVAITLILFPTSTNILTAISVVALVVSDLLMHRIGGIDGRWYAAALALFAGALVFNALGRSGASTCTPNDVLQFHGIWHVLSAVAFGAYFVSMTRPRNEEPLH
ncbi:MAG: hypothetical protein U9R51_01690 [Actinomycetota bacterium]|nr:hypothetical protein [Actinomycetota bacterium]